MAALEASDTGSEITLETIKDVISKNETWRAKLSREIFSDHNISQAMDEVQTLFG